MDIDNASTTSTTTTATLTVIHQDEEGDILELAEADANAMGDGNESDCEHDGGNVFTSERDWEHLLDDLQDEENDDGRTTILEGAPPGWEPFGPPDNWSPPAPKDTCPSWDEVNTAENNPAGWSSFTYQARYNKSGKYIGHRTPSGATVVPAGADGKRTVAGWDVQYNNWTTSSSSPHRHGAGKDNLIPDERKGCLDKEVLTKMGLTKKRLEEEDFLFLHQLILPIGEPSKSGIDEDHRMPFYTHAAWCSNQYAIMEKRLGCGYGHSFDLVTPTELVRWDGIVLRHCTLGGGDIHVRFIETDPGYDPVIARSMSYSRWLQIKSVLKLNMNNAPSAARGNAAFDPANKYDYIYQCYVDNFNPLMASASLDLCLDETTWANMSYGGEVLFRVKGKPGVTKGGQVVMVYDVNRKYPLAHFHRHSLQPRPSPFTQQGPSEVYGLFNKLNPLVLGNEQDDDDKRRQIFSQPPHLVADNHFSGDAVMEFLGRNGWAATITCRRDRLIKEIDKKYFNHEKKNVDKRSKVARYENPIIFSKTVEPDPGSGAKGYERTHTSFQSTGSTNVSQVNAENNIFLYGEYRKRGVGESMREWAIEMLQPRATYLNMYGQIDTVDLMAKGVVNFTSWKFWHSPMNHCKSLIAVSVYDMYLEIVEGGLDPDWKLDSDKIASFRNFRLRLSEQMCKYRPQNRSYPGDDKFRQATQQNKKRRKRGDSASAGYEVDREDLRAAVSSGRLCSGDFEELRTHLTSVERRENKSKCFACGKQSYYRCKQCGKPICFLEKGKFGGGECFMDLHDVKCFGLCRSDARVQKNWKEPSPYQRQKHADYIHSLLK